MLREAAQGNNTLDEESLKQEERLRDREKVLTSRMLRGRAYHEKCAE